MKTDKYVISKHPQRSPEWFKIVVVSSTDIGTIMGHNPYSDREKVKEKFILGYRPQIKSNWHMERGVRLEPLIRDKLVNFLNQQLKIETVIIKEIGTAISTSNPKFGTSIDGLVYFDQQFTEMGVEIKAPCKMYSSIDEYNCKTSLEQQVSIKNRYQHIKADHYDQIQWHNFILDLKGCFYTVYVEDTEELFIQFIPRNDLYIDKLKEAAHNFLKELK